MPQEHFRQPERPFRSAAEEREHLSREVANRERFYPERSPEREQAARQALREYQDLPTEQAVDKQFQETEEGLSRLALELAPEEHDEQMAEFMEMVHDKGIKNTLAVVEKLNNPHLEDDFHRFLVEYLRQGYEVEGLKPRTPLSRSLRYVLYEVILPRTHKEQSEDSQKPLKELLAAMEQFFAGMRSISQGRERWFHYAIELALPEDGDQYSFYVSLPRDRRDLLLQHLQAIYSDIQLVERYDDYNIFNYSGAAVGSNAIAGGQPVYTLKTYEQFSHDPLNVLLNSLAGVDKRGEGAAIQLVVSVQETKQFRRQLERAKHQIKEGTSSREALKQVGQSAVGYLAREMASGVWEFLSSAERPAAEDRSEVDQQTLEQVEEKLASPLYLANLRLVASSRTAAEAEEILSDMESAFNQFEDPRGNKLEFRRAKRGALRRLLKNYTFRHFSPGFALPLNTTELTTLIHFETLALKGPLQLKETKGSPVPVPAGLPDSGIRLGINRYREKEQPVYMTAEDRLRHFYIIGQTGTGKTTLLKNMMAQDLKNGEGLCFIDPHGADIQDVLAAVPRERAEDVIYFDPSYTKRPMGLNMLEYDPAHPEQKTFVVNELFKIFQQLYAGVPESMGPMFEQYFRNAAMLVVEDPESGNTLLDISRVLSDKDFRDRKLSRCNNPVVTQFWQQVAEKAGGESSLQNIVPYITSKFDVFMSNEIMRPIIAQERSAFNFREIMDNRRILLVNLSKGLLGDLNANLLGLIVVGKILMSTLSRVDQYGQSDIAPFYLYIDEFQNVTTDSISTILSEARKYKLGLNLAHQFIAQLDEEIKKSVFGNVGSMAAFRIGSEDAEFLEEQFQPTVSAQDLMNVQNRNAYLRMLVDGEPVKPFSLTTEAPEASDHDYAAKLKQLSYATFGEDRTVVEERIRERYQN